MKTIGENVQEAIDFMESGLYENAFRVACFALEATLKKELDKEELALLDYKDFVNDHWKLISFMCLPGVNSHYLETQFVIREISLNPHRDYTVKEIVIFFITYVLKNGKLPPDITFASGNNFDKKDGKLLVPSTLVSGLLGLIVLHPVNKNETIPDKYWINISDFKMFISELWGRIDLAERVRKFYRERD
jgi:hypothetical protein